MLLRLQASCVAEVLVVENVDEKKYCLSASQAGSCDGRKGDCAFHTDIRQKSGNWIRNLEFVTENKPDGNVGVNETIMVPESKC